MAAHRRSAVAVAVACARQDREQATGDHCAEQHVTAIDAIIPAMARAMPLRLRRHRTDHHCRQRTRRAQLPDDPHWSPPLSIRFRIDTMCALLAR
ncbi:MAG TPA: hypothetical protein VK980_12865 [Sphingomonas sp.]|nr:hypothetical protein [Sphingomonas sp.]